MKKSLLFLLILGACGEYKQGAGGSYNSIGQVRSLNQTQLSALTNETRAALQSACNALAQKQALLSSAVNTQHTFTASQTDCDGNVINSGTTNVTIQNGPSGYVFKKTDGQDFIFAQVETTDSGLFANLCSDINSITFPIAAGAESVFISAAGFSSADCTNIPGQETCLMFERGTNNSGNTSTVIHTREWIRIRTGGTAGRIGFFTQRKKISRSFCANNEVLSYSAELK